MLTALVLCIVAAAVLGGVVALYPARVPVRCPSCGRVFDTTQQDICCPHAHRGRP